MENHTTQAAKALRSAQSNGKFTSPLRETFTGLGVDDAYAIQKHNIDLQLSQGARIVGSKIGLTSLAVQRQIGVDQPDYGVLLDNMEYSEGIPIPMSRLQQPKIEAEVAFILGKRSRLSMADCHRCDPSNRLCRSCPGSRRQSN